MKIKLPKIKCINPTCGYSFTPRTDDPKKCPRCQWALEIVVKLNQAQANIQATHEKIMVKKYGKEV